MKSLLATTLAFCVLIIAGCSSPSPIKDAAKVVDAACGQCLLGLKEKKGCDLAVRIDGQSYFVDGFTMKQLGDAHADDGMCNAIRKAKVTGEIVNGRFVASSFDLLPAK